VKRHQPAILGGLFIGVLSSLPVVRGANVCCCLWVVLGGLLTVYLQQQNRPDPVETSDAVIGGLIAGLIGAVITVAGQAIMLTFTGPLVQDQLQQALEAARDLPPEIRQFVTNLTSGHNLLLLSLAVDVPVFAVFGMLGALLGTAFFKKKVPPAPPTV
jgi:hypothetical protein